MDGAKQFNVSRTAVRGAIKIPSAKGLVKVRQGSGAVVNGDFNEAVTESLRFVMYQMKTTFSELMEARRTLEVEIAGIAAERATEEDLIKLRQTLNIGEREVEDLESYVELDVQFHLPRANFQGCPSW
ncbi:TPA: FadR family transcriptional regulator [Candidatus Poribacteria bacterium]|nr:FadR family transcriptional regulator [Candidatus Poribacteria bacterium]